MGAEPEVHSRTHGICVRFECPRAIYPADLSSSTGTHSNPVCLSKPKTKGVERDPGEKKTLETPRS